MTNLPPRAGCWTRFRARPRWQRFGLVGGTAIVALAGVGAAAGGPAAVPAGGPATAATGAPAVTAVSEESSAVPATTNPAPTIDEVIASTTSAPVTTSAVTDAPTTTIPGSLLALDVLAAIPVADEQQAGYDRDRFGYAGDSDGDGCDTRAEVLMRDSTTFAQVDPSGCTVVAGDWFSVYDGATWQVPGELEIDHVVALKEAHDSGAWAWSSERLVDFGNDLDDRRSLRAVTAAANRDKSDADPSNWLPADERHLCTYLGDWVAIKARWALSMDQSEHGRIGNLLEDRCPGHTIAPWPAAPADSIPPTTVPATTPPATPVPAPVVAAPVLEPPAAPAGDCDLAYPTICIPAGAPDLDCGDISERRFQVLAPDPHGFDGRDDDGIGCES